MTSLLIPEKARRLTRTYQTFVHLDEYETKALRKLQSVMKESRGKHVTKQEVILACVRYCVHDLLGEDFILGRDASDYVERRITDR